MSSPRHKGPPATPMSLCHFALKSNEAVIVGKNGNNVVDVKMTCHCHRLACRREMARP